MKNDIIVPEVKDVLVAAVPRKDGHNEELWDIFIINLREAPMENVLITSQGYGEIEGKDKTTTVLRHFHQSIGSQDLLKVEPIQRELFGLKNEYWISFNHEDKMLDKRFVFTPNQIDAARLEDVPVLNRPGVVLR
ncbi:hypothetical protein FUA23_18490 [Neolewinella aurantiaca]|uniref:Uncharacterized protein n=1 Tax=Neolewinella aurantiaca TaxID=2602767 RepID=A0A5C7FMG2_9BACT|nr:hypothetical protein [Neolewinella aurantiaca]TXF87574.1 hypothetical protein FUA23_18490 [Neolewinella aurantiaca]